MKFDNDFDTLGCLKFRKQVAKELPRDGITTPSAVQEFAIPAILAKQHVILHSGTGTGKTLGYLLPILQLLENPLSGRCVVMTPNPELAMQTLSVANRYKSDAITTAGVLPNITQVRQKERLTKNTQ